MPAAHPLPATPAFEISDNLPAPTRLARPGHRAHPLLTAKWEVVQHTAIALAQLAHLEADEIAIAVERQPHFSALHDTPSQRHMIAVVDDLVQRLQPGLRSLVGSHAGFNREGRITAALNLWREFREAQAAIIAQCATSEQRHRA